MSKILMVTWDGGGNVPPLLHISRELQARGHEVMVLGHASQSGRFESEGIPFSPRRYAPRWTRTGEYELPELFGAFVDGGAAEDVEELVEEWRPDSAVVDCLLLGAIQAAQARGIPNAVLMHSFWGAFGEALPQSPLTDMAAPYGREPTRLWGAASEVLVVTDRELDPVQNEIPANVHWTGVAQPAARPAGRTERDRALLSLSTVWFPGQQESMQCVLDGLEGLPVRVIATIDGSISAAALRVPSNVEVRAYVDHKEVMPEVAMVIGHGGHATTMYALAHDLPLLIVPQQPLADQLAVGEVLVRHGAGILLAQHPSAAEVRDAVTRLIEDDSYAASAARIGARLRAEDGTTRAADRIEALVGARVPG